MCGFYTDTPYTHLSKKTFCILYTYIYIHKTRLYNNNLSVLVY